MRSSRRRSRCGSASSNGGSSFRSRRSCVTAIRKWRRWKNRQVPVWAAANRPKALHAMAIVDEALRDRPFIAGDRFTVADITGLVALDFAKSARIGIPPELVHLNRWHEALKKRPSAAA